jgi:hypothetical protein
MTTSNWEKGLSLGGYLLCFLYFFLMSIQVCRKQISSKITLFADFALVGPECVTVFLGYPFRRSICYNCLSGIGREFVGR